LFQDVPGQSINITNPTLSTFIFVGFQGRFDVGGERRPRPPSPYAPEYVSTR
jgi:hypothetical protein